MRTRSEALHGRPHDLFSDAVLDQLHLPGLAVLLVALKETSATSVFSVPVERFDGWYGFSERTAERGYRELVEAGLLRVHRQLVSDSRMPRGVKARYHRALLGPLRHAGPPRRPATGSGEAHRGREGGHGVNLLLDLFTALQHLAVGASAQPAVPITFGGATLLATLLVRRRRRSLQTRPPQRTALIKIGSPPADMIDAVVRLTYTRGRNRDRHVLCKAIAAQGTPQDQLAALSELSRTSPMDAPGASLYRGHALGTGAPRHPVPHPETTIVIPEARTWPTAMEDTPTADSGLDAAEPGSTAHDDSTMDV